MAEITTIRDSVGEFIIDVDYSLMQFKDITKANIVRKTPRASQLRSYFDPIHWASEVTIVSSERTMYSDLAFLRSISERLHIIVRIVREQDNLLVLRFRRAA